MVRVTSSGGGWLRLAAGRACGAALTLAVLLAARGSAAVVGGRVTADGKPLAKAWVQLNTGLAVTTDARGRFAFPPVPRATYALQAFALGREPAVTGGVVAGKGEATLDLKPATALLGVLHIKTVRADRGEACPFRLVTRWRPGEGAELATPAELEWASTLDGQARPLVPAESVRSGVQPFGACLWSQGEAVIALPPGQAELTCSSGPLMQAVQETVEVKPGEVVEAAVSLPVGIDLGALGWTGGTAGWRVSGGGGGGYLTNLPLAAAIARGEGLSWVALAPGYGRDGSQGDPEQTARELSSDTFQIALATESIVPLGGRTLTIGPGEATLPRGGAPLHYQAAARKRGVSIFAGALGDLAGELPLSILADPASVPALDLRAGSVDRDDYYRLWSLLLNHGFRVAAVSFEDLSLDAGGLPLGPRTYVRTEGDRSLPGVAEGIRRGATLVSGGPLLTFAIAEALPGQALPGDDGTRLAEVDAWMGCAPGVGLARVELVRAGEVVRTWVAPEGGGRVQARIAVRERQPTWMALRAYAAGDSRVAWTSPIYFASTQGPSPGPPEVSLKGRVYDKAGGQPIAGARVTAAPPAGKPVTVTTTADGSYALTAPASSMVEVTHPGYVRVETPFVPETGARQDDTVKFLAWDHPVLCRLSHGVGRGALLDWSHYEAVRQMLSSPTLDFPLQQG